MSTLSTAAQNAAVGAVAALVDGGSGAGKCVLTDGGSVIVTFTLSDPSFSSASGGSVEASSLPKTASASGSGDVDGFELRTSADTLILSGTAGESNAEIILNNASVNAGQTCGLGALALDASGLGLVFFDDFSSGSAPDYAIKYFPHVTWGTGDSWGPGEADDMREDAALVQGDTDTTDRGGYSSTIATVSSGELHLRTVDTTTRFAGLNYDHGTSMIRTRRSWLFGVFEVRMRVPAGQGFLAQLWLMPEEYEDGELYEVDICEVPFDHTTEAQLNAHWGSGYGGPDHHQDQSSVSMDPTQWHVYRLTWTASQYIWEIDDVVVKTFTHGSGGREVNSTRPMQLIINLDVGGSWAGATDGTTPFPSAIDVSAIKVFQAA